jgi:hypothetical protein
VTGSLSLTGLDSTSIQKRTNNKPFLVFPTGRMKDEDGIFLAIIFASWIGGLLICALSALGGWCCHCCFRQGHAIATPIPKPTTAQQKGDASDGHKKTYSSAPAFTQDWRLGLSPPVVMRENGGYSLRQQLSPPTESTLLPMYMDGSDG